MLFAHIADTHLGYRQFNLEERELDFYRAWHESVDIMISEGVDVAVHSGDLFDEPRPPIRALVEAKRGIKRLTSKGVRVVMIPGNHDMLMRRGAMAPHAIFDGVDVLTLDRSSIVIDDVFIGGVPYLSKSYQDILLENIRGLAGEAKDYKQSILVLHQGLDKYLPYEHELGAGELPEGFSYYAMGHVHSRIEDEYAGGHICYPGSTEIWRADEVADWEKSGKGFLTVDAGDMRPRRVDLSCVRPVVRAEVSSVEEISALSGRFESGSRPVVSLRIRGDEDFNVLYEKAKEVLSEGSLYLDVRKISAPADETFARGEAIDLKMLLDDALGGLEEDERIFAFDLFKRLGHGDVEGGQGLADDFYLHWKRGEGQ
ncbi:MAG: exonuclease SbcCD subunit D [Candidatus Hydrothermarchaeales archaeon]